MPDISGVSEMFINAVFDHDGRRLDCGQEIRIHDDSAEDENLPGHIEE